MGVGAGQNMGDVYGPYKPPIWSARLLCLRSLQRCMHARRALNLAAFSSSLNMRRCNSGRSMRAALQKNIEPHKLSRSRMPRTTASSSNSLITSDLTGARAVSGVCFLRCTAAPRDIDSPKRWLFACRPGGENRILYSHTLAACHMSLPSLSALFQWDTHTQNEEKVNKLVIAGINARVKMPSMLGALKRTVTVGKKKREK